MSTSFSHLDDRLHPIGSTLPNGVYDLFHRPWDSSDATWDSVLMMMVDGHLFGADRWGGLVTGRCDCRGIDDRRRLLVSLTIPCAGLPSQPCATEQVAFDTDLPDVDGKAAFTLTGTVEFAGQRHTIELHYRGPVPLPESRRRRTVCALSA
jgi:hypothetical protein